MKLPAKTEQLLSRLLEHEMLAMATTLRFEIDGIQPLSDSEAVQLANIAERLSRKTADDEKALNLCLSICALLGEHRRPEWRALPALLVQITSRISLGPTAKMLDPDYDHATEKFSSLGSLLGQFTMAAQILESEVEVAPGQRIVLSQFQQRLWEAIDDFQHVGVSAPTSAGKSFVLVNKMVSLLLQSPGELVYVVPTISLINQVTADFKATIRKYGLKNFSVFQTYSADYEREHANTIYVLTQERALAAFGQEAQPFKNLRALVVDEIQNLERAADSNEERAHTLYHVLQEFRSQRPPKVVIAGPRINNIQELIRDLFGGSHCAIATHASPVMNLAYSFKPDGKKVILKQYSTIRREPITVELLNADIVPEFGKKQYKDKIHAFIHHLVSNLDSDGGTLIFSPTSPQSLTTARALADLMPEQPQAEELIALQEYVARIVHPEYELVKSLGKGVACHHGKLPLDIRRAIEKAFSRSVVRIMTTTTTLMQGINLPAKHIIARNPFLHLKRGPNSASLTGYEFANLRGRAGRLMKDVVGRAIVLDETSFDESDISLAELDQKTISHGYKEKFERNRSAIVTDLTEGKVLSSRVEYLDVEVYVRQMIMRYGEDATTRLYATGIVFSMPEFREITRQLSTLKISADVCAANPYWDPLVLDEIRIANEAGIFRKIPRGPFDGALTGTILSTVKHIKEISPFYFDKYLGIDHDGLLQSIAISAQKWAKETPLHEVIRERKPESSKDIHSLLDNLTSVIPYGLTKLLKPVVAIQDKENPILSFIEMGAYRPITRRLLEIGIGRETAIPITDWIEAQGYDKDALLKSPSQLMRAISIRAKTLGYWERTQLEDLVLGG